MTGVGVGDLATAGFAGAHLGTTVLWAVLFGAIFKYVLSEGVARWQLATGTTLLHGAIEHLRWPFIIFFALYFFPWCWFVGGALINAAGVAGMHLAGLVGLEISKFQSGVAHTLFALSIILLGRQRIFNSIMSVLAVILFLCVLLCMIFVAPPLTDILSGLLVPSLPENPQSVAWTVALIGGVGGTLTLVCYGYWIVDSGRTGEQGLKECRLDLTVSYTLTALFGIAMVIIGAAVVQQGKGLNLLLDISEHFSAHIHPALGILFLLGAWAAIFSSLLGVWQVIPQVFADCLHALRRKPTNLENITRSRAYFFWALVMALTPILSLEYSFKEIQKLYSMVGAFFMPVLAAALLWLNREHLVTERFRNHWSVTSALSIVLVFFIYIGGSTINKYFS